MGAAQEVDRRFQHVARKSLLEDRPAAPAWASNLVDAMSSARRGETARLCAVAGGHSAKRTDWRRQQDSKRRFLSQNTSLFFGNVRPKVVDRSGLEPAHHLSGTECLNSARPSSGSAELRTTSAH